MHMSNTGEYYLCFPGKNLLFFYNWNCDMEPEKKSSNISEMEAINLVAYRRTVENQRFSKKVKHKGGRKVIIMYYRTGKDHRMFILRSSSNWNFKESGG